MDGAPSGQKRHAVVGSPANIAGKSSLQTPKAVTCLPWANETCFAVPHASSLACFVYIYIIVSLLHNLYYSHIRTS